MEFNTGLLHKALEKRGIQLHQISNTPVFRLSYQGKQELLYETTTNTTTFAAGWAANDKFLAKQLLIRAGISVPAGHFFPSGSRAEALAYAKSLGFPVVAKPTQASSGDWVYPLLESLQETERAIERLEERITDGAYYVIEQHIFGEEYRLFVTDDGFFAAIHRSPPAITGDGRQTIRELITEENERRTHPRTTSVGTIKIDSVLHDALAKKQLTPDSVLQEGQTVQLRPSTNVSKGGFSEDVTDSVHPSVRELSHAVLAAVPGLTVCGIDCIVPDISKPLAGQTYAVIELNTMAGLSLHVLPGRGTARPADISMASQFFRK